MPELLRRLGLFDAVLIVIGSVIGSGIFMNPSVVARFVRLPLPIMAAWIGGGLIGLAGAAVTAELASRRPGNGGAYAYLRDAFHPAIGFMYGWTLLLLTQSGGAAASAVTFAVYFEPLTGWHVPPAVPAVVAIAVLTAINCLGVRQGANVQNLFVIAKVTAIGGVVVLGLLATPAATHALAPVPPENAWMAFGLALVPVFFAYFGWATSTFVAGEVRDPERMLPRALMLGVLAVVALYLAVNAICLHVLGPVGLAGTRTPASDVVAALWGPIGARAMAGVVALSTLGFVSNQILTAPRVYYQMAQDGVFFRALGSVNARTHVPTIAIAVQGLAAIVITVSGSYDTILNWVTSADFIIVIALAVAVLAFRRTDARSGARPGFVVPGGATIPVLLSVVALAVVIDVLIKSPRDTLIGFAAIALGWPAYRIYRSVAVR